MDRKTHLLETFRWSAASEADLSQVFASGIGMAAPVLIGAGTGHLDAGLAASVGAFVVGGVESCSSLKAQLKALVTMLIPTAVAVIVAALISGYGWRTDTTLILLVCAAATVGSYSRAMIAATTRLILFMVIMVNIANSTTANQADFLPLLVAGGLFTVILNLMLGSLVRAHRRVDQRVDAIAVPQATAAQKFVRWKKSLMHLSGWQYPLRLALCLSPAAGLQLIWPSHHLYWVSLTVVLLSQRKIERFPVKTTQRALGTALGVIVASLLIINGPADWIIVTGFGLLACVRPILKTRNYLAYSAVMTPLVILMMDASHQVETGVLVDRLIATLLGAALVITVDLAVDKILTKNV